MGLWDKIKSAANAVTGGGAKVSIEYPQTLIVPGQPIRVRVTATSTGGEIKSKGCFIDLWGSESVHANNVHPTHIHGHTGTFNHEVDVHVSKDTFSQAMQIGPAFVLAASETKQWEGTVQLPPNVQPTFSGTYTQHEWKIRGRIEAFGNDPDSGYLPIRVGLVA